jgi:acetyl esterase/lipase
VPRVSAPIGYFSGQGALDRNVRFGLNSDRIDASQKSAALCHKQTYAAHQIAAYSITDHPAYRGGIPISGIFDLEPIALNYLNEKLRLDTNEVATLSPLRVLPSRMPLLRLFVGGNELPELQRQSTAYAEAARSRGLPVALRVLPAHHHFSILDEISRPDGAITRALVEMTANQH